MREHRDYPITIYLNQAVVFDLLAIMDDGMAQVSSIRTAETNAGKASGGLGASNVFALVGVRFGGEVSSSGTQEVVQERVHTPSSLFAKMRRKLMDEKLVVDLTKSGLTSELEPGTFVECAARFKGNPLADPLQAVVEAIATIKMLQPQKGSGKQQGASRSQDDELKPISEQIKRMVSTLSQGVGKDIAGDLSPGPGSLLVTVENRYLGEHSIDELSDGQYRVFGKVIQTFTRQGEQISLLRNTQLATMPLVLEPMKDGFAATKAAGLALPEFQTHLNAPVMQVIPIAIYA